MKWLCYGDVGLDEYPHKTFLGGISFNHLVHLNQLGEKDLFFYGPLSSQEEGERINQALAQLSIKVLNHELLDFPPPRQKISINSDGEKKFLSYDGEIFSHFNYQRIDSESFDTILIPVFEQNFPGVKDILLNPPQGKIIIDILDGADFDMDLTKFLQWEKKIDTLVVGCPRGDENFYNRLKESVSDYSWKLLVTRGERSGFYFDGQKLFEFIPTPFKKVIDSTGAGDAFLVSFLTQLYKGGSPDESLNFASRYTHEILSKKGPN